MTIQILLLKGRINSALQRHRHYSLRSYSGHLGLRPRCLCWIFLNRQTRFARLHCSAFGLELLFMWCKEETLFTCRYVRPDPLLKDNKKNVITIIGTGKINGNSLDTGCCEILSFSSFGTGGKRFPGDNTPKVIQNVNKIV